MDLQADRTVEKLRVVKQQDPSRWQRTLNNIQPAVCDQCYSQVGEELEQQVEAEQRDCRPRGEVREGRMGNPAAGTGAKQVEKNGCCALMHTPSSITAHSPIPPT